MIRRTRIRPLPWAYDDGGRAAAGFRGEAAGDCACRAIAIAAGRPYREVYDALNKIARVLDGPAGGRVSGSARAGVSREVCDLYLAGRGWAWTAVMGIGTGCRVHLRTGELPPGRVIARVSGHLTAVIGGTVRDTHDPGRGGQRCVYGFYREPDQEARP